MMPTAEALVIARVFVAIAYQIDRAWKEDRPKDACSMARLMGQLQVRIGGFCSTPLDEWHAVEVAA